MCESSDSSDSEESEDSESNEEVPDRVNTNHACSVGPRRSIVHPLPSQLHAARVLVGDEAEISIGPVEGRGKDLPIFAQKNASRRVVEVGCEQYRGSSQVLELGTYH